MTQVQRSHTPPQVVWGIKEPSELLDIDAWKEWNQRTISLLHNVIPIKYNLCEESRQKFLEVFQISLHIDPRRYIRQQDDSLLHTSAPTATSLTSKLSEADYRAGVNRQDEFRFTPLHIAAFFKNPIFANELLFFGADPSSKDIFGSTPLHIVATMGCKRTAKHLLGNEADLTSTDKSGNLPIHLACMNGHTDLAISLIDHMTVESLNQRNCHGNTPLHLSVNNHKKPDKQRIVAKLIERDVDLNTVNVVRTTPLIYATQCQSGDCVRLLVEAGADKNITDSLNYKALDWARGDDNHDIIKILSDNNANENIPAPVLHNNSGALFENL